MKILITNDDGISSPCLLPLARWAKQLGDPIIIAPKVEQSGKSHAIEFHSGFEIKKLSLDDDIPAYSVDSTPADCVRYAILGLHEEIGLVISGINRGFNLGKDTVYSGTLGAIFEAARLGMPGIALSTSPDTFDPALAQLDTVCRFFKQHQLLARNGLYNVNIPPEPRGIRITRLGGIFYTDEFVHQGNDVYLQVGHPIPSDDAAPDLDTVALADGYISVTPLLSDRTNFATLQALQQAKQEFSSHT